MVSIFHGQLAERTGGNNLELVEDRFVALQRVGSRKEFHLLGRPSSPRQDSIL